MSQNRIATDHLPVATIFAVDEDIETSKSTAKLGSGIQGDAGSPSISRRHKPLCRVVLTSIVFRPAVIGFFTLLVGDSGFVGAAASSPFFDQAQGSSVSRPLPPEYVIGQDGSVVLRVCFNWCCARRQTMTFTPDDMALLKRHLAVCPGTSLHDRLQRVRIGIWQMELLAQKYQPLLANDLAINLFEAGVEGRMDCVDNSSNTTNYLHVLRDIGELAGWSVSSPKMRSPLDITAVHWTAVIIDTESGLPWSVDSWYRPNGHLPMVMPLASWIDEKTAWKPPFERLNATPHSLDELCETQPPDRSRPAEPTLR